MKYITAETIADLLKAPLHQEIRQLAYRGRATGDPNDTTGNEQMTEPTIDKTRAYKTSSGLAMIRAMAGLPPLVAEGDQP